jgi:hypothetical protein
MAQQHLNKSFREHLVTPRRLELLQEYILGRNKQVTFVKRQEDMFSVTHVFCCTPLDSPEDSQSSRLQEPQHAAG